ncbi:DOMON-like domain-containing protein [Desulfopila sp. IMCC35008]|uniref:DOMON-like domain-containing protein n=1 Tax=Desulfopila sp. IMCC35008 TaxID=2653858 RepID=UPI0013D02ED4|nr:DOMON-like domain-containing protein [Desulfopila sp. IMCC35008]
MDNEFTLIPFTAPATGIKGVSGTVRRQNGCLIITYRLTGNIESISMPLPQAPPARRDGLWKGSCFECFVQAVGHDDYHEINLAPNGDWNVYHFTKYRAGMAEESAIDRIESAVFVERESATIRCRIALDKCYPVSSLMQVGISCILLHRSGTPSHWALKHLGSKPDFHDSRAFCISLLNERSL